MAGVLRVLVAMLCVIHDLAHSVGRGLQVLCSIAGTSSWFGSGLFFWGEHPVAYLSDVHVPSLFRCLAQHPFFLDLPYHAHRRCHVPCALGRQRPPSGFSARSMGGRVYMLIACYGNSVRGIVQAALVEMPLLAWTSWPPIWGPFNDPRFGPNENDKDCPCYSCLAGIWPQKVALERSSFSGV